MDVKLNVDVPSTTELLIVCWYLIYVELDCVVYAPLDSLKKPLVLAWLLTTAFTTFNIEESTVCSGSVDVLGNINVFKLGSLSTGLRTILDADKVTSVWLASTIVSLS